MKTHLLAVIMLLVGVEGASAQQIRQPPPTVHAALPPTSDTLAGTPSSAVRDSARAPFAAGSAPVAGRTRGATIGALVGLLLGGVAGYVAYQPSGSFLDFGRPPLVLGGALVGGVLGAVVGAVIDDLHAPRRP